MDKNTIIAIVLSALVIIAGVAIQTTYFPAASSVQTAKTALPATTSTKEDIVGANASSRIATANINEISSATPKEESLVEEKSFIETPLVRVEFTNRGGDIISYKLKQHSEKKDLVEMADCISENNRAFSLILGDAKGVVVDQLFNVKKISATSIGFFKTFTVTNKDGTQSSFTLVKEYDFLPNDYMFELKVTVAGDSTFSGLQIGDSGYTIKTSPQIGPKWNVKQDKYEYRKFYHFLNGKKKSVGLNAGQTKVFTDKIVWTGIAGKYFTLIALPENPVQSIEYSTISTNAENPVNQIYLSRAPITANKCTDTWKFYVGPRTDKYLSKYNIAADNPYKLNDIQLDKIVESSGILAPLEILLKMIMEFFYKIIPNWGVSIIILTILTRIILFPLTKKSSEATLKMQELQPKIKEIQQKYSGNPQKMNEEMAKFYQTAGYNPLSGCLPLLIQFPLIFAMYNLFNNYFEFRGAMFIPGWIPDLSQGDSVYLLPFTVPFFGWANLRILPIVYVISQLLFGKVTQTPGATQQNGSMKFMLYGMPLIFFFIFYNAPSGLLIYWTFSNILTLVQQVIINRIMHKKNQNGLKLVKN